MGQPKRNNTWKNRVFLVLELVLIPLAVWWAQYSHLPPPGWAVAVIAFAAAAMSVHDDLKDWQKGMWMLLIGAFLITELRSIRKDRAAQDAAFASVRDTQNSDFNATAKGLSEAIAGIQSTFNSADAARLQTRPHAYVHFTDISYDGQQLQNGSSFRPGAEYPFDFNFINDGNQTGVLLRGLPQIYVGKPDDRSTQLKLVARFMDKWRTVPLLVSPVTMNTHSPRHFTARLLITKDEFVELSKGGTIYAIGRVEYRDSIGVWQQDYCELVQRTGNSLDINQLHQCSVFNTSHAPLGQR